MTLDEAIKHAEEVAKEQEELYLLCPIPSEMCDPNKDCVSLKNGKNKGCIKCAEEHEQLAEWLKDYKRLKEQQPSEDCVSRSDVIKVLNNHWLSGSCSRRIIDEQIDKVKALPSVSPTTCIAKVTFSKDDLQELVDEKVKELAQRMESRWIPVSERLPEENGGYLVTVNQRYITTALWWGIPKYWDNVIAWMPLPKPYKSKKGE